MNNSYTLNEEVFDVPKLDLCFVFFGAEKGPFSVLSPYHRYILYLYYGMDMNIREVAEVLDRDKNTIWTELHYIYDRIRAFWD
jgi:hypothetical protein